MFNLLSMELYRLRRQKTAFWVLFSLLLILILGTVIEHINLDLFMDDPEIYGLTGEHLGEDYVLKNFYGSNILLFMNIFASIFFTAPYRHGFTKHILGKEKNRTWFAIAQFKTAALYLTILFLFTLGVQLFVTKFFLHGFYEVKDFQLLIKPLIGSYFGHLGILSLLLLIASATRSLVITLLVSIFYCNMFGTLIYGLLNWLLGKVLTLAENFSLHDYTSLGAIMNSQIELVDETFVRGFIASITVLLVCLVLSTLFVKKKDI